MDSDEFQAHVLEELSNIRDKLTQVEVNLALLQGKAIVWGSLGGIVLASVVTYLVNFSK